MKTRGVALLCPLALVLVMGGSVGAQTPAAPPEAAPPDGVEVLARGPMHEAFAEPVIRGPRPTPVVDKPPPDPIEELPPNQKPEGDNVQWIPGYWAWDEERADYLWVSGTWRAVPPDRQWLPGHWNQAAGGWQWVAGFWQPRNQPALEFLPPPPDPAAEVMTPAPAKDDVFVPGTWVFQDGRYLWRPGFWVAYRPGWVWMPAHYIWTPAGYLFVEGYWDFPLANRGLLFAPVYVTPRTYLQPGWSYRPVYVVDDAFLTGALFVRLVNNHYYFGDYFDPQYARLGFTPWVDFRVSRSFYDPLFAYYRWQHRADPAVESDLQQLYAARRDGKAPRPPRTLAQQQTAAKTNTTSTVGGRTTLGTGTALTPLGQVKTTVKLQPVTTARLADERKVIQQYHDLSRERGRVEAKAAARRPTASGTARSATPVKVELSRAHPGNQVAPAVSPGQAPPALPAAVSHTVAKPQLPDAGKPAGERHQVTSPETKPVRPTVVKPEPKPVRPPDKPAPEAKPAPKPPAKPEPRPAKDKSSDKK